MRTSLISFFLALLMPVALFAQSTETETEAQEGTSIEDQLSLGEEADPEPQVGQTYIAEDIGDWEIRCIKTAEGEEPCQMYQLMSDSEGSPVAEISIFRLAEGSRAVAGATIVVPLETSLQQQVTMQVDDGQARRYPFAFCNPVGCMSRVGLVQDEIDAFKRGNEATLTIVPALAPDQKVGLTMSLKGFTAAYDKASVVTQ